MENLNPQIQAFARDTLSMLRFFTRLPIPALPFETDAFAMPDFTSSVRALPLAGALIGLCAGLVLVLTSALGLPASICVLMTMGALALITGAMHEDGLADVADGFFGSSNRERKLEIMKDSRLGTFGVVSLLLVVLVRFAALNAVLAHYGLAATFGVLVAVSAVSRMACVVPMWLLPPARADGASYAAERPTNDAMLFGAGLAALLAVLCTGFGAIGLKHLLLGLLGAAFSAFAITEFARRHIGGQTGDVAGAAQQKAEIAFLIGLLVFTA